VLLNLLFFGAACTARRLLTIRNSN
jgi:hypothetical protein